MKGRKETLTPAEAYVAGLLVCILCAEAVHILVLSGQTLSTMSGVWAVLTAGVLAVGLFLVFRKRGMQTKDAAMSPKSSPVWILFLVPAFLQLVLILSGNGFLPWRIAGAGIYRGGDMTLETVNSFLATDGVYEVNPLTGAAFEAGMPLRLKLLGLPTLYALICRLTGWEAVYVVRLLVPVLVWLGTYMAYGSLAEKLFKDRRGKGLFMLAVSLLLLGGSYVRGMDGFGLLYGTWRGESIRSLILLPFLISCLLGRRWILAAACILCEACLVWTLYGAGWSAAITGIMGLVWFCRKQGILESLLPGFFPEKGGGL